MRTVMAEHLPEMYAALARFDCLPCEIDVLNPCFAHRPADIPGKHWGGGEACKVCHANAVFAMVKPAQPAEAAEAREWDESNRANARAESAWIDGGAS